MKIRANARNTTQAIASALALALGLGLASEATTLRGLAEARGLSIGAAVAPDLLFGPDEPEYARTLAREFNIFTAENTMKWGGIHPARDQFAFGVPDLMVKFALEHGMKVRGHNLAWHQSNPPWLLRGNWNRDELTAILRDHIQNVVGHFKGRIVAWDVVNEAVGDDAKMRETIWSRIGPDYIERALRWARDADPEAKLFYNDYNAEELNAKSQKVYELVRDLKSRGAPIDGVGLQMHVGIKNPPDIAKIAANIRRLNDLGLEVQITEMDVKLDTNAPLSQQLEAQGRVYADVLRTCLAARCTAFVMWGVTDAHTWLNAGKPLLFDGDYRPKPAYAAIRRVLEERPK